MSDAQARARARRAGTLTSRTIRLPVPDGTLADGTVVASALLTERLGYLAAIVRAASETRLAAVWDAHRVGEITAPAASHAWVAMGLAYGRGDWPPAGLHASDRVRRMADELAGRTLRSAARQIRILTAILPVLLPSAHFQGLLPAARAIQTARLAAAWPAGTTEVERRNTLRSIVRFEREQRRLPTDPYELQGCPSFADGILTCPLDASDDQGVRLEGSQLSILLPLAAAPTREQWAWHSVILALPAHVLRRYPGAMLARPSIRVTPRQTYFLLPLDLAVPALREGERVLGLDWGVRRLLTGAIVEPDGEMTRTTGRPYFFSTRGMSAKICRLRAQAELLATKITRIEKLLAGQPDPALAARLVVVEREKAFLWRRISAANEQLAHAAARWAVETALAEGAVVISVEDLATLEAKSLGRTINGRNSITVRGMLLDRLVEKAQLAGIRVVTVAASGTSANCSRCGRPSVFYHAPDRRTGHGGRTHKNWLVCACGRSSDRDHAAAENIGARGIDAARIALPARRRRRPIPGPASQRPIRVQHDRAQRCTRLPLVIHHQMIPPRPCDEAASRRVGRGSAVVPRGVQAERIPLSLVTSNGLPTSRRVLDGLCGGYRLRVRLSRVRALAPPPETQLRAGS